MARMTSSTTHTIEIDEIGVSFTTTPAFAPYDADTVRWAPRPDGGYYLAWLALDDDRGHDYWDDRESGMFHEFRSQEDRDEYMDHARRDHGADRVIIVEKYEHSLVHYSPVDTVGYPDRRWDVSPCAVFIVPEDVEPEHRIGYAKDVLDEYSSWCNGDVFGVVVRAVDANGNPVEDLTDECWGFIGHEYAQSEADEAVKRGGY
jgi:hypothetical protein